MAGKQGLLLFPGIFSKFAGYGGGTHKIETAKIAFALGAWVRDARPRPLQKRFISQTLANSCKLVGKLAAFGVVTKKQSTPAKKGPFRQVKVGNVSLNIYKGSNRKPDGREYDVYTVVFFELGNRHRKFFSTLDAAKEAAETIAARLDCGEREALKLSNVDVASYLSAMEKIKGLGIPLHTAIEEYVYARGLIAPRTLAEAAEDFVSRQGAPITPKEIGILVDEFIAIHVTAKASSSYINTLRSHLNRFKKRFPVEIGKVTVAQLEDWLTALKANARYRNNLRGSLVVLFTYARKRGHLPKHGSHAAAEITVSKNPCSIANVYPPEDLFKILKAAKPEIMPAIAIAAFTGMRMATVSRLSWEDIKWAQNIIIVPGSIAKMGKRYIVPLLPCLVAWLSSQKHKTGLIVADGSMEKQITEAIKASEVKRQKNGFRDSYISYRVAETMNLPQVAYEAGNSVDMIKAKYLDVRTKEEATAYFSIIPTQPENVLNFSKKA